MITRIGNPPRQARQGEQAFSNSVSARTSTFFSSLPLLVVTNRRTSALACLLFVQNLFIFLLFCPLLSNGNFFRLSNSSNWVGMGIGQMGTGAGGQTDDSKSSTHAHTAIGRHDTMT